MEKNLSIIIPVYNEKESLSLMVKILNSVLEFNNEIIIRVQAFKYRFWIKYRRNYYKG